MRIGIDIDDTITDTLESLIPKAYEYNEKINEGVMYTKYPSYENSLGLDTKQFVDFFRSCVPTVIEKNKPKKDFVKYLNLLKKENEIFFITARSRECFDDPYDFTEKWFQKNGITNYKLFVECHNKKEVCKKYDIDLFIDDSIDHCTRVSELNIPVLLFDSRLNRHINHFERVSSWKDVYDYVKEVECGQIIN